MQACKETDRETEIAEWHLTNWARWMRAQNKATVMGYNHKSAGFSPTKYCGEEYDEINNNARQIRDAAISWAIIMDLPEWYGKAIEAIHLGSVFPIEAMKQRPLGMRMDDFEPIYYNRAVAEFWRRGQRKGLV